MQYPSKPMLVTLGIIIGLIFFGLNISIYNFNRLVAPDQLLCLVDWQVKEEKINILMLGETLQLQLDDDLAKKIADSAGELLQYSQEKIGKSFEFVEQKAHEIGY